MEEKSHPIGIKVDSDDFIILSNNAVDRIEDEDVEIFFPKEVSKIPWELSNISIIIPLSILKKSRYFRNMLKPIGWYTPIIRLKLNTLNSSGLMYDIVRFYLHCAIITETQIRYRFVIPTTIDKLLKYKHKLINNDPNHEGYLYALLIDHHILSTYLKWDYYFINLGFELNVYAREIEFKYSNLTSREHSSLLPAWEFLEEELRIYAFKIATRCSNLESITIASIIEVSIIKKPICLEPSNLIMKSSIHRPTILKPTIRKPTIRKPIIQSSTIRKPAIHRPTIRKPIIQSSIIHKPVIQSSIIHKPVIQSSIIHKPVIQSSIIHKPVIQSSIIRNTMCSNTRYIPQCLIEKIQEYYNEFLIPRISREPEHPIYM